jgi:hypothetical protein
MTLGACLGELATHLQVAGQSWVEGNIYAQPHLEQREPFEGSFLRVLPETLQDGWPGYRIIVDTPELPREGWLSAEHVFDDEWQAVEGGEVHVFDDGRPHSYWLHLKDGLYTVNEGYTVLPEIDTERIRHVTDLIAVHAEIIVETVNEPYWYS